MELGKHIVTELQLRERGDWLRHWLAHHIAELIRDAQDAPDQHTRRRAAELATEAILKVWGHRADLPGNVNPLAHYREALKTLLELKPPNNGSLKFLSHFSGDPVVTLVRRLPRLVEALVILPSARSNPSHPTTSSAVKNFLTDEENSLLNRLQVRIRVIGREDDEHPSAKTDLQRFEGAANKLIDDTIDDLRKIRRPGRRPASKQGLPRSSEK